MINVTTWSGAKKSVHDASGIEEPETYLWYEKNGVFYPYLKSKGVFPAEKRWVCCVCGQQFLRKDVIVSNDSPSHSSAVCLDCRKREVEGNSGSSL